MPIEGTKDLGNWGKMVPTEDSNIHITHTNENADRGPGAHITTQVPGVPVVIRDYFDADGNYTGSE